MIATAIDNSTYSGTAECGYECEYIVEAYGAVDEREREYEAALDYLHWLSEKLGAVIGWIFFRVFNQYELRLLYWPGTKYKILKTQDKDRTPIRYFSGFV